jgi:hypothetical protein
VHGVCERQRVGGVEIRNPLGFDVNRLSRVGQIEEPEGEEVLHDDDIGLKNG